MTTNERDAESKEVSERLRERLYGKAIEFNKIKPIRNNWAETERRKKREEDRKRRGLK